MKRNIYLSPRSSRDIDIIVKKILRDLGDPKPPLDLDQVRHLLRLDRRYYSSTDEGFLSRQIHKLKVATKQVISRPRLLLDVVRKLNLQALWLPDTREILLDRDIPTPKQRWNEAHEISHSFIPWHRDACFGDQKLTLSVTCHEQIEAEANYGAGRLLFLQEKFEKQLLSQAPSIKQVLALKKEFGNTITSTLWRAVEALPAPAVGLITDHPRYPINEDPVRYTIYSREFLSKFGAVGETTLFSTLQGICSYKKNGPLADDEVIFNDLGGCEHIFRMEIFHNTYDALTLAVYSRPKPTLHAVA